MALQSTVSTSAGRILVVDDDKRARDFIVSSLRAAGHDVDASSTALEARRPGSAWAAATSASSRGNRQSRKLKAIALVTTIVSRASRVPPTSHSRRQMRTGHEPTGRRGLM